MRDAEINKRCINTKRTKTHDECFGPIQQLAGSLLSPLPPDSDIIMRAPGQNYHAQNVDIYYINNNNV